MRLKMAKDLHCNLFLNNCKTWKKLCKQVSCCLPKCHSVSSMWAQYELKRSSYCDPHSVSSMWAHYEFNFDSPRKTFISETVTGFHAWILACCEVPSIAWIHWSAYRLVWSTMFWISKSEMNSSTKSLGSIESRASSITERPRILREGKVFWQPVHFMPLMSGSHITLQPKTGCPLKLSRVEPGQYLDGRPPEKTRLLLEEGVSEASRGCSPCGLCGS